MKKLSNLIIAVLFFASIAQAQQSGQVTVSFNEQFFDALLDAIFTNLNQPTFPLASNGSKSEVQISKSEVRSSKSGIRSSGFSRNDPVIQNPKSKIQNPLCDEKITLLRESGGVRTGVKFRDGRIYAPIAFSGAYNPPLVGCIEFRGVAETIIELEFDRAQQRLVGRVRVENVRLGGAASLAGGFLARLVQSSIDAKINPIEILRADRLTFLVPVQNSGGSLRLRATDLQHEIGDGVLNVRVVFEFSKAE